MFFQHHNKSEYRPSPSNNCQGKAGQLNLLSVSNFFRFRKTIILAKTASDDHTFTFYALKVQSKKKLDLRVSPFKRWAVEVVPLKCSPFFLINLLTLVTYSL